jgi:hypothetical protein
MHSFLQRFIFLMKKRMAHLSEMLLPQGSIREGILGCQENMICGPAVKLRLPVSAIRPAVEGSAPRLCFILAISA